MVEAVRLGEYGGIKVIGRCVVVEDAIDAPLGKITRDAGL